MPLAEKLNVRTVARLFVTVTVCAAVVVPTVALPKGSVPGESVTGETAVPVRLTSCGEFVAVSFTVIAPVMLPTAVGANVDVMAHDAPAASEVPQVFVWPKFPLDVIKIVVEVEPAFFTVTILPVLVVPIACEVNVKVAGVTVTEPPPPPPVPVPVKFTT